MVIKTQAKPYAVLPTTRKPGPEADKLFVETVKKLTKKLKKAGKPKFTTQVRLVTGSLRKNFCKDRSGGAICGSVYEEVTRDEIGRIVKSVCYPNKHERQIKRRKEVA